MNKNLLLTLLIVVGLSGIGFAVGCETPWILDEDDATYTMTEDLSEMEYDCIDIDTNGVTLDCGGYAIDSTGPFGISAIEVCDITIKNCVINGDYMYGIYMMACESDVYNNEIDGSVDGVGTGMYIYGSDTVDVHDNTVENCVGLASGVHIYDSEYVYVYDNEIRNNWGAGVYVAGTPIDGSYNKVYDNTITGNDIGVEIYYEDYTSVYGNTMTNNGDFGVYLYGAWNNNIYRNKISGSEILIYLEDYEDATTDNNIFYDNDLRNPVDDGNGPFYFADDSTGENYLSAYEGMGWIGCDGEDPEYECQGNYYDIISECSADGGLVDENGDGYYDSGDNYPVPFECGAIEDYFQMGAFSTYDDYAPRVRGLTSSSHQETGRETLDLLLNPTFPALGPGAGGAGEEQYCYGAPVEIDAGIPDVRILMKYHGFVVNQCWTDANGKCSMTFWWPGEYVLKAKKEDFKPFSMPVKVRGMCGVV